MFGQTGILQNVTGAGGLLSKKKEEGKGLLAGKLPQIAYTPVAPGMIDQLSSQLAYGGFGSMPQNQSFLNNLYGQTDEHKAWGDPTPATEAAPETQSGGLADYWVQVGYKPMSASDIRRNYSGFANAYDSGVYHTQGFKGIKANGEPPKGTGRSSFGMG